MPADAQDTGAHFLFFSGIDLWRNGDFMYGGALWSPEGLGREGFTLKALVSGGAYNYLSGALGNAQVDGRELTAQVMPGWRFKVGHSELKVSAGLDLQNHHLSPNDPDSHLKGNDAGLRAAFEFWTEPTARSMIAIDGSASTVAQGYSFRAAVGWRASDLFYVGPEIQAFASDEYSQRRIGFHITAFRTGAIEWSAATGYARDSDRRASAYVRIGLSTRR
jgi:hypothetical protein